MNYCSNCKYFVLGQEADLGTCHRYPPKIFPEYPKSLYPDVHKDKFCGEFSQVEMKIPAYITIGEVNYPLDISIDENRWIVFYKDVIEIKRSSLQCAVDEMYSLLYIRKII